MKKRHLALMRALCVLAIFLVSSCVSYSEKLLTQRGELRFADLSGINYDSLVSDRINTDREKRIIMFADWKDSFVRMHEKLNEWPYLDTLARELDSARVLSVMEADTIGSSSSKPHPYLSVVPMTDDEVLLRLGKQEDAAAYYIPRVRLLVVKYNGLDSNYRYSWTNAIILLHELSHDYLYLNGFKENNRRSTKKYGDPNHQEHAWIRKIENQADSLLLQIGKKENSKWSIWNCYLAFEDKKDGDKHPSFHFAGDIKARAAAKK